MTVADLEAALDRIAPFQLAAEWDNVGLLAGSGDWPVEHVLVALDLTDAVAREALTGPCNAVVLYHPPIFGAIKRVTPQTPGPTALLPELLASRIALLATHTALDAASGGTNDALLDVLDIAERRPLKPVHPQNRALKLVTFAPPNEIDGLRAALSAAGAGVIGDYTECSYTLHGAGTFVGGDSSNPTIGQRGRLETVDEVRLEMVAPRARLSAILSALYATHSYEEPAFDLYPLVEPPPPHVGMGRVGALAAPTTGTRLLSTLASAVDLSCATVVGDLERSFTRVVAAAGSFGVDDFHDRDALVLTGEFRHHDALAMLRRGVCAVALGHAASEQPVLPRLVSRLNEQLDASVRRAAADAAPMRALSDQE